MNKEQDMISIRQQLLDALMAGDDPNTLICFVQDNEKTWVSYQPAPIIKVSFEDLPDEPFDSGYGGVNGPYIIAFSERFIYIKQVYDGAEDIGVIPRHPEYVDFLPTIGGG